MKYTPIILLLVFLFSCEKKEETEITEVVETQHYEILRAPGYLPEAPQRILHVEKAALGKKLFFDPNLSGDGTVSCASCHLPNQAFSDTKALSVGVKNRKGSRNSPPLFNLVWHNNFFRDGGASDLESQAFAPLIDENEMASNFDDIIAYLDENPLYKTAFKKGFKDDEIKSAFVLRALAEYERTLFSGISKYDLVKKGKRAFTEDENKGYVLYQSNCSSCHTEGLFSDHSFHNNHSDSIFNFPSEDVNLGRARITNKKEDLGKYKTPSLRNLSYTSPYMHDGRLATLEEVISHYSELKPSSFTDSTLTKKNFSEEEKKQLLAFLKTLDEIH